MDVHTLINGREQRRLSVTETRTTRRQIESLTTRRRPLNNLWSPISSIDSSEGSSYQGRRQSSIAPDEGDSRSVETVSTTNEMSQPAALSSFSNLQNECNLGINNLSGKYSRIISTFVRTMVLG